MLESIKRFMEWTKEGINAVIATISGSIMGVISLVLLTKLSDSPPAVPAALVTVFAVSLIALAIGIAQLAVIAWGFLHHFIAGIRRSRKEADQLDNFIKKEGARSENRELVNRLSNSSSFFASRFSFAFPATEGVEWHKRNAAARRLASVFSAPFSYQDNTRGIYPIWYWTGGGDMYIHSFKKLAGNKIQINETEYSINKIAAYSATEYYRKFIY